MPPTALRRVSDFLGELKRRKVYRVTAIYAVLAVGGLEVASAILPSTALPEWFDELFLGLAIVGLPLVLVLAWTFDVTEAGIVQTPDIGGPSTPPGAGLEPGRQETVAGGDAKTLEGALRTPAEPTLDRLAVAVLPFENLSGSEAAEPFAVGLHDDLLTELSRASALTVISRTSVKGYRKSEKSIRTIAREVGAGTIVEGGVQAAGNRVRLNVQLIDARTDRHIWAERYDRELTAENIFDLQSELAGRIMSELHAQLTAEEEAQVHARPTGDLEAYQLVVTGRQVLIDRSEGGFRAAAALFERAIERDPGYALAWAGLADALVGLVDYGHVDSKSDLERGRAAALRALELDPHLAEAHTAFGQLRTAVRDAPGAASSHARAIELRPGYAGAHQWSCWAHLLLDEAPEALAFGLKATRLDPHDPEAAGNLAFAHLLVGDAASALEEARRIRRRHPHVEYPIWVEGLSLQALGRWAEGSELLDRLRDRWTRGWPQVGRALTAFPDDGGRVAREVLADLERDSVHFKAGVLHALLGEVDDAFHAMSRAQPLPWDEALYLYLYVHSTRPFDELRGDPRFAALVADVKKSWQATDA